MHRFYRAQITPFGPSAVVITTAFQNAGGYYKGESFCIFPEPHPGRAFTEIKFDQKTFAESPIALTDEFMLEEALGQAKIDLALHIQEQYSGKEFLLPPGELRLEQVNVQFLVHLRVQGAGDFLWDIQNKTKCYDLQKVLEPLFKLPTLTRNRMSD
ncbi:MAG: hypothetical protein HT579_03615 [Candidatus Accumulibacter similis]|nr:MAG: hypothetical protein HT579_03615 [Candidatus Accumulibacter similis]